MNTVIVIVQSVSMVLSLIISVIALVNSYKQTELSNKQDLFNERINNFVIVNGLLDLYKSNKSIIEKDKEDEIYFSSNFLFISLINNSYLEKMGNVINKPLINSKQKDFLSKIEEIKNEALKIKFIYNGKEAIAFRKFVDSYANFLIQYMSLLDLIKEMQEKDKNNMDVHEFADKVDEKYRRKELFEKIDALKESYNKIDVGNVVEKIEKQIKM